MNVNPGMINGNSSNFAAENTDSLNFAEVAKKNGMTAVKYDGQESATKALTSLNDSSNSAYAIAQVPYTTSNGETGKHWVNVNGPLQKDEAGISWIEVGPTSTNDGQSRSTNDSEN